MRTIARSYVLSRMDPPTNVYVTAKAMKEFLHNHPAVISLFEVEYIEPNDLAEKIAKALPPKDIQCEFISFDLENDMYTYAFVTINDVFSSKYMQIYQALQALRIHIDTINDLATKIEEVKHVTLKNDFKYEIESIQGDMQMLSSSLYEVLIDVFYEDV